VLTSEGKREKMGCRGPHFAGGRAITSGIAGGSEQVVCVAVERMFGTGDSNAERRREGPWEPVGNKFEYDGCRER